MLGAVLNFKLCTVNVKSPPIYLSNLGILYIEKHLCSSKAPCQSESPGLLWEPVCLIDEVAGACRRPQRRAACPGMPDPAPRPCTQTPRPDPTPRPTPRPCAQTRHPDLTPQTPHPRPQAQTLHPNPGPQTPCPDPIPLPLSPGSAPICLLMDPLFLATFFLLWRG